METRRRRSSKIRWAIFSAGRSWEKPPRISRNVSVKSCNNGSRSPSTGKIPRPPSTHRWIRLFLHPKSPISRKVRSWAAWRTISGRKSNRRFSMHALSWIPRKWRQKPRLTKRYPSSTSLRTARATTSCSNR